MAKRSKPLLVAPLIPFLALAGIFGIERLHGSRHFSAFVMVWCVLFAGLFAYVLQQALEARRRRARP